MTTAAQPRLEPGRVYRTRELAQWTANPSRTAKRLAGRGDLQEIARGVFACPKQSQFGPVPPRDNELLRAFLGGTPFVLTGPEKWNALGLGTTAVFAAPLVYNKKRSGTFVLGGRRYVLRRVAFPDHPSPEWFVVDLLENAEQAGASREQIAKTLTFALSRGSFDSTRLRQMARAFGTKQTQRLVDIAIQVSG